MKLIWLVVLFVILFAGQTLNRLPRDVLTLKKHYQMKDWPEFCAHLVVCAFFWLGSTLAIVFFILPIFNLEVEGLSKIWDIITKLGR